MEDSEKLIEEAGRRRAMNAWPMDLDGRNGLQSRDERNLLRQGFELGFRDGHAFEKAHTPTDDDREALILDLKTVAGIMKFLGYKGHADTVLGAIEALRRPAQEPSARCPKCGVAVTDQTASTFYTHHDETCGGPLEEPQDAVVTLTAEAVEANREYIDRTQGVPSGADRAVEELNKALTFTGTGARREKALHDAAIVARRALLRAARV